MDAIDFLSKAHQSQPRQVYVLFGDEDFLKRQVRAELEPLLLEDADPAIALSAYSGETAIWSTIRSELETLPFLSPRRVVAIEQADPFVSEHRAQLEKYVAHPAKGTLILDVRTWQSTTKLAKALPDEAQIACKALRPQQLPSWCVQRAKSGYAKKLSSAAADLLVALIEPSLGLLDQELAKLATYVGERTTIDEDDVDKLCGRSRAADTFKIFAAIGEGKSAEALEILHRLRDEGAEPLQVLGAFSWQLRKLAQAGRLVKQGESATQALSRVGFAPFALRNAEQQMRHLGMRRLEKLFDWLLEMDLGLKGSNPLPPWMQMERFVVRLAQPREAPRK
jgi:DNA polymerase-3 subunit delta